MACDTNICIKSMTTPNPLAFSLPKQWQQSNKHGTRIGTNDKPMMYPRSLLIPSTKSTNHGKKMTQKTTS
jgi:hypothetical protein